MYEELPLELLSHNRNTPNRIPRMFFKKLRHNIAQIGQYETLTVRPHPEKKGGFEVLNGHARLDALRELGANSAKCDIWEITDLESRLFLAVLNRLRGSEAPELRMGLLFDLLRELPKEDLVAHVPETISYLNKLEQLEMLSEESGPKVSDKP